MDIVGYEECYQVSNYGRVRSVERFVKHAYGGLRRIRERLLISNSYKSGYVILKLSKCNIAKTLYIHQLVSSAFLGLCSKVYQVNHIDGNKLNNHVDNLEYVTCRENINLCKEMKGNMSSTYRGVHWSKTRQYYVSRIMIDNKRIHLGCFESELDASKAYQNALCGNLPILEAGRLLKK